MLVLAQWPTLQGLDDPKAEAEIGWFIDLVTAIRSVRAEMNVPTSTLINLELINPSRETFERARIWDTAFNRVARIGGAVNVATASKGSIQLVVRGDAFSLPLYGVIDLDAEGARLQKEMQKADADIKRVDAKLGNPKFVANAPDEVVEEERDKRAEAEGRRSKIAEAMERLKSAS